MLENFFHNFILLRYYELPLLSLYGTVAISLKKQDACIHNVKYFLKEKCLAQINIRSKFIAFIIF